MDTKDLEVIVNQSGLEQTKADYMLSKFKDYFSIASEWEKRAKEIIVNDDSQKDVMAIARIGRLALREKRIELEKERKSLKEQSLREGKAIDGIANVLKAIIQPIEDYLDAQENFTKYRIEEEQRMLKIEADKKAEIERQRVLKEEEEKRIAMIKENLRLRKEAEEKELAIKLEREAVEKARIETERKANEEKRMLEQAIAKEKAKAEAEKRASEKREFEEKEKSRIAIEKVQVELKAKAEAEKKASEKVLELEKVIDRFIKCPICGHEINLGV